MILKVRDGDGDVVDEFIVTDRADIGPEIQQVDAPLMEAGTTATVDIDAGHCSCCVGDEDVPVGEILGIEPDELSKLANWRTSKRDGVSSAELGRILDKVVKALDGYKECVRETSRIVLQVEPST